MGVWVVWSFCFHEECCYEHPGIHLVEEFFEAYYDEQNHWVTECVCVWDNNRLFWSLGSTDTPTSSVWGFPAPRILRAVLSTQLWWLRAHLAILRPHLASGLSTSRLVSPRQTWTSCCPESLSPCSYHWPRLCVQSQSSSLVLDSGSQQGPVARGSQGG